MDTLCLHGANVVRFQLDLGGQWWFTVGYYLSPDDASIVEDVVAAISQRPRGAALLVTVYFNVDLAAPEVHARDKVIVASLCTADLEDMSDGCGACSMGTGVALPY